MALAAGILWEFQAIAGLSTNGGGFDPSVAVPGTDHAYAGATFSRNDIVIGAVTTTITSAADPFAADDDGNVIQITAGATATPGYYTIISEAAGVATLDRSAGTAGGGVTGAIGPLDVITNAFINGAAGSLGPQGGDTIYVKDDGVMTLAGIAGTKDGTAITPICIHGYKTTRDDEPTGGNRPVIACGANSFTLDNYWDVRHLDFTGTTAQLLRMDNGAVVRNCKIVNISTSANRAAMYMQYNGTVVDGCEASSVVGQALSGLGAVPTILIRQCWIRDSDVGLNIGAGFGVRIVESIIDTCTTAGISITTGTEAQASNCDIYNCAIGILGTTGGLHWFDNNIIDSNVVGASWTTEPPTGRASHINYNNWHGNATDVNAEVTKGANATASDPLWQGETVWTDLACAAGTNVITSVAGGFTGYFAVDELIHIESGTNFTAGWYRVLTHDGDGQITLTSDPKTVGGNPATIGVARACNDFRTGAGSGCRGAGTQITEGVGP